MLTGADSSISPGFVISEPTLPDCIKVLVMASMVPSA